MAMVSVRSQVKNENKFEKTNQDIYLILIFNVGKHAGSVDWRKHNFHTHIFVFEAKFKIKMNE